MTIASLVSVSKRLGFSDMGLYLSETHNSKKTYKFLEMNFSAKLKMPRSFFSASSQPLLARNELK